MYDIEELLRISAALDASPLNTFTHCQVSGCVRASRSSKSPFCENHYYNLYRYKKGTRPYKGEARTTSHGYVCRQLPGHPIASLNSNSVYEHRRIFYDNYGEGPFQCHVCGGEVGWEELHIDHLNDIKDDNRLCNLKPSHPVCNQSRGRNKAAQTIREKIAIKIEFEGKLLTLHEWASSLDISVKALRWRLANSWSIERALTEKKGITGPVGNNHSRAEAKKQLAARRSAKAAERAAIRKAAKALLNK